MNATVTKEAGFSKQPRPSVAGLSVVSIGLSLIVVSHWFSAPDQHSVKLVLETIGVAVLVGGLVHLLFSMLLIRHFLEEIEAVIVKHDDRLEKLNELSIVTATSKLSVREFVKNMVATKHTSGDGVVRIMQSIVFEASDFTFVIGRALDYGRPVQIVLGNPKCPSTQARVAELRMARGGSLENAISDRLKTLIENIRNDPALKRAYEEKRISIGLYTGIPAAALWSVDDDILVSWFLCHRPSIGTPHIHCKAFTRLMPIDHAPSDDDVSLGDEMLNHFHAAWKRCDLVGLDYGQSDIKTSDAT